jgi:hypothetical protein
MPLPVIIDSKSGSNVDVGLPADLQRVVDHFGVWQSPQRFHISMPRVKNEQVAALAAGGAINAPVWGNRERPNLRFARGDDVNRGIS